MHPLKPAQREGLEWLSDKPRAIYAAGCGLGKTRTTIEDFLWHRLCGDCKRMFVLAPKNAAYMTWPAQIKQWAPELKVNMLNDTWEWDDSDVIVLHYNRVKKLVDFIRATKFWPCDYVVLDEVTCARNPKAVRMTQLAPILQQANFVRGLTGTPRSKSEADLYGMMQAVFQDKNPFGQTQYMFTKRYFDTGYKGWDMNLLPGAKEQIWGLVQDKVLCQKTSEYLDLPDISYVDIEVPLGKELMADYKVLKKKLFLELKGGGKVNAASAGVLVNKLLQFTSGKIFEAIPHPTKEGKMSRKVNFIHDKKTEALLNIKARPLLVMKNFSHTEIPSAVDLDPSHEADWNAGKIPLAIGHPAGIGIGVNLQAGGCNLCWHTQTWSLIDKIQAEARLWRTGQTEPVTVYRLLCPGTVDEAITLALDEHEEGQDALMTALSFTRDM